MRRKFRFDRKIVAGDVLLTQKKADETKERLKQPILGSGRLLR